jgi:rubrerythrin
VIPRFLLPQRWETESVLALIDGKKEDKMDTTIQEIVLESLKGELQSVDLYLVVTEAASSEGVKRLAQQLAAEEEKHLEQLVDWLEQDGEPTLQATLREVRLLLGKPSRKLEAVKKWVDQCSQAQVSDSLQALLELAIAKEAESISFIGKLENQVEDSLARRVLGKIRQDEERHKHFLEQQYEELLGAGSPVMRGGSVKFRKVDEWEDHRREPGGDEVFLLEAVEVPPDRPRYRRVSWAELTDEEFDALERGETINLKDPGELTEH